MQWPTKRSAIFARGGSTRSSPKAISPACTSSMGTDLVYRLTIGPSGGFFRRTTRGRFKNALFYSAIFTSSRPPGCPAVPAPAGACGPSGRTAAAGFGAAASRVGLEHRALLEERRVAVGQLEQIGRQLVGPIVGHGLVEGLGEPQQLQRQAPARPACRSTIGAADARSASTSTCPLAKMLRTRA